MTAGRYDRSFFKVTHDLYDPDVSLNLAYHWGTITRGNNITYQS